MRVRCRPRGASDCLQIRVSYLRVGRHVVLFNRMQRPSQGGDHSMFLHECYGPGTGSMGCGRQRRGTSPWGGTTAPNHHSSYVSSRVNINIHYSGRRRSSLARRGGHLRASFVLGGGSRPPKTKAFVIGGGSDQPFSLPKPSKYAFHLLKITIFSQM